MLWGLGAGRRELFEQPDVAWRPSCARPGRRRQHSTTTPAVACPPHYHHASPSPARHRLTAAAPALFPPSQTAAARCGTLADVRAVHCAGLHSRGSSPLRRGSARVPGKEAQGHHAAGQHLRHVRGHRHSHLPRMPRDGHQRLPGATGRWMQGGWVVQLQLSRRGGNWHGHRRQGADRMGDPGWWPLGVRCSSAPCGGTTGIHAGLPGALRWAQAWAWGLRCLCASAMPPSHSCLPAPLSLASELEPAGPSCSRTNVLPVAAIGRWTRRCSRGGRSTSSMGGSTCSPSSRRTGEPLPYSARKKGSLLQTMCARITAAPLASGPDCSCAQKLAHSLGGCS